MKRLVAAVVMVFALCPVYASAQPANNSCANATVIGNGQSNGTTVGATADGSSNCDFPLPIGNLPDVWFRYTATCTGTLTIYTCDVTDWDPIISVHTGCPGTAANQIICNDQAATPPCSDQFIFDARVSFAATAGVTYRIRVAARNPQLCVPACTGPIQLVVQPPLNPPIINNIPNGSVACGSTYTGPTPALSNPACMSPVSWSLVTFPPGSSINTSTGVVQVPPQPVGTYPLVIRATNASGFDNEDWTVTVNRIAPFITTMPDETADAGVPYNALATVMSPGCMNPITWSLITAPAGMTINATSGAVYWPTPTVAGSPHTVTARATNSAGSDDETWLVSVDPIAPLGGFYWRRFLFDGGPPWPPAPTESGQQNRPTSDPVWTKTQVIPPAPPTAGPIVSGGKLILTGLPGSRHQWTVTAVIPDEPSSATKTINYRFMLSGNSSDLILDNGFISWSAGWGPVGSNVFDMGVYNFDPGLPSEFPIARGPFLLSPKPEQEWFSFTMRTPAGSDTLFVAIDDFFFSAVCDGESQPQPLPGYPPQAVAALLGLVTLVGYAAMRWRRVGSTLS